MRHRIVGADNGVASGRSQGVGCKFSGAIGGTELAGADIPKAEPMRSAYLTLNTESDTEAERIFSALSDGGQVRERTPGLRQLRRHAP